MAHFSKFSGGALGHMLGHYDRSKENIENIDPQRSHLNYNLAAADQPLPHLDFLHKRLSEVRVQNRKDVNKLCDWVVTAPKDLPLDELPQFFQHTYSFLRDRYGKENVVSAYVHMDEASPHVHFAFVPVAQDRKRGGWKLSAKEAVTRKDLQTFHSDLQAHLEAALGHSVGILNGATQEGNKSIAELKRQSAVETLTAARKKAEGIIIAAENQAADAAKNTLEAKNEAKGAEREFLRLAKACNAKEKELAALNPIQDDGSMYPEWAKIKKTPFSGETVTVPKEKWEQQHRLNASYSELQTLKRELDNQMVGYVTGEQAYQQLEQENKELRGKIDTLTWDKIGLKEENKQLHKLLQGERKEFEQRQQSVLQNISSAASSEFLREWNAQLDQERQHLQQRFREPELEL